MAGRPLTDSERAQVRLAPESKAAWVSALRGGRYPQGHGILRRTSMGIDTYCCLGVRCDLEDPGAWNRRDAMNTAMDSRWRHGVNIFTAFEEDLGTLAISILTTMNDGEEGDEVSEYVPPASFNEIADWIEANL